MLGSTKKVKTKLEATSSNVDLHIDTTISAKQQKLIPQVGGDIGWFFTRYTSWPENFWNEAVIFCSYWWTMKETMGTSHKIVQNELPFFKDSCHRISLG